MHFIHHLKTSSLKKEQSLNAGFSRNLIVVFLCNRETLVLLSHFAFVGAQILMTLWWFGLSVSACRVIRQSDKSVNNKALAASLFACALTALPLLISSSRLCFSSRTRHSSVPWINPAYALFPSFIPSPIQSPLLLQWSIPQFPFPSSLSSPSSVWGTSRDIRKDVSSCSHPESKEWTHQSKPVKSAGIAHLPPHEVIREVLKIWIDMFRSVCWFSDNKSNISFVFTYPGLWGPALVCIKTNQVLRL